LAEKEGEKSMGGSKTRGGWLSERKRKGREKRKRKK